MKLDQVTWSSVDQAALIAAEKEQLDQVDDKLPSLVYNLISFNPSMIFFSYIKMHFSYVKL